MLDRFSRREFPKAAIGRSIFPSIARSAQHLQAAVLASAADGGEEAALERLLLRRGRALLRRAASEQLLLHLATTANLDRYKRKSMTYRPEATSEIERSSRRHPATRCASGASSMQLRGTTNSTRTAAFAGSSSSARARSGSAACASPRFSSACARRNRSLTFSGSAARPAPGVRKVGFRAF